jgi:hypothetical protein
MQILVKQFGIEWSKYKLKNMLKLNDYIAK